MPAPGRPRPATQTRTDIEVTQAVGTLVVAIFDADTKQIAWAGEATEDVRPGESIDDRQRRWVDVAVQLLREFPPR